MILNIGGGASGYALVVKSSSGVTVTITKDGNTYANTTDSNGTVLFGDLPSGTWTVTLQKGGSTKTQTINITKDTYVEIPIISSTISVTYPADSVCTCTKDYIVLEASDTSGSFTFNIPELGDWVVSCNNGLTGDERKEASKTVSITTDGQSESINMSYELKVLRDGVLDSSVGNWINATSCAFSDGVIKGSANNSVGTYGYFENKIDVTGFNTLKFILKVTSHYGSQWPMLVGFTGDRYPIAGSHYEQTNKFTARVSITATHSTFTEYSLDISSISGEQYFSILSIANFQITDIWLE